MGIERSAPKVQIEFDQAQVVRLNGRPDPVEASTDTQESAAEGVLELLRAVEEDPELTRGQGPSSQLKVVVDDAVVTGETKPYVIYETADEPAAVGDERR